MMIRKLMMALVLGAVFTTATAQNQVYELRTYEMAFGKPEKVLHQYLEQALIPALNRQGIGNIGVFEEIGESLPKKIYLLMAFKDIAAFQKSQDLLAQDSEYQQAAKDYFNLPQNDVPFTDYHSSLIRSTPGFPELTRPAGELGLFELRIYESYNEDALRRKVKMFNESEFTIFEEVGLPMVFFGYNMAGSQQPCLTYMLGFKDKAAHDAGWAKFGPHPEWQRIVKLDEYKDTVNNITRVFLKPVSYSQL